MVEIIEIKSIEHENRILREKLSEKLKELTNRLFRGTTFETISNTAFYETKTAKYFYVIEEGELKVQKNGYTVAIEDQNFSVQNAFLTLLQDFLSEVQEELQTTKEKYREAIQKIEQIIEEK